MAVDDTVPEIRFAQARGGRIAWQRWGSGDEDVVAIPPAAQNVEVAWERHEIRAMFDRFGSFSRFLHYDKRGTGASDRGDTVPGLDTRVDVLRGRWNGDDIFVTAPPSLPGDASTPRLRKANLWNSLDDRHAQIVENSPNHREAEVVTCCERERRRSRCADLTGRPRRSGADDRRSMLRAGLAGFASRA